MTTLLLRRAIRVLVVCVGVSLITFGILQLSGDPVALMMPEAPEADRAKLREAMGFNDPVALQFVRFVGNSIRGEFGKSFYYRAPALDLVLERMPTTLTLTVLALGLAVLVSIPAGIYSAVYRYSLLDQIVTVVVFLGQSMPVFWTGIMLMLLFAVQWRLLPVSGWEGWQFMILPAVTLGTFQAPLLLRIVRSSMLEVLGLDYVRTARSKGVSEWIVICRHALVNAALPVVTVTGLQFGILLGGAVITETVFAVPGVGRLIVRAILQLDFPVVQAGVFLLAMIVVTVNFVVDVLYAYLNPQIRVR
ncbi:MAG: ABC transporter permease [Candidatus Rokubacteria bacterium]|nr:ABC transporter permease [Candidatus Rokubacteria bacterium]MBI2552982.1 ABC transporter permease [Candidatus Rokubacteria bacterium]